MVRLLFQHEVAGPAEGIESRLAECTELILAVAVGEVGEHEEGEPVGCLFVEGPEDARLVGVARVAFEHGVSFVAAVLAEVAMQ